MTDSPATQSAKTRRRWLTFAEIATVLALIISAASFWDSHREREETRIASSAKPAAAPLVLTAKTEEEGDTLTLAATGNDRVIQTQTIVFPTALDVSSQDTIGSPRIESGWFASALRTTLGDERKPGRLPIGIITKYTDNGTDRTDTAIYDIGHKWRTRLLQSDVPTLEGITLVNRLDNDSTPESLQKRLDARWTKNHHPTS